MKKQKRILISRPDRLGDVILSTPIPREIKKTYPDSFVAILLRSYAKDIYVNNPYVDEIIIADDILASNKKNFWQKVKEIRRFRFSHALMLLPNERINYLLFFAGIMQRIGTGHKFYQFITGVKGISRHKYIPLRHEADYCMDLARAVGVETDNLKTEIVLTDSEKGRVREFRKKFASLDKQKKLIGIHTTSGNSAPNWTVNQYREFVLELRKNSDYEIFITDNVVSEELKDIESIEYPNVGLTLRESIINFAAMDVLVSASTGPMHMCAALGVKTVSLFCPLTACSPKLWGPKGNDSRIILPDEKYCSVECPGDPKKCTFSGEGGIGIEKVITAIKEFV